MQCDLQPTICGSGLAACSRFATPVGLALASVSGPAASQSRPRPLIATVFAGGKNCDKVKLLTASWTRPRCLTQFRRKLVGPEDELGARLARSTTLDQGEYSLAPGQPRSPPVSPNLLSTLFFSRSPSQSPYNLPPPIHERLSRPLPQPLPRPLTHFLRRLAPHLC